MTPMVEVGTVLIEDRPSITQLLALEIPPYAAGWSVIRGMNGSALGRKIHAAGWNFFFMAGEVKVVFLGSVATTKVRSAIQRILKKVRPQNYNCLELTRITEKRFLGIRYATVAAHSRHIQQSCYLDQATIRRAAQRDADWAKG
jgi:hypothetical protein